ncbi:MAG TPA: A24 family peptidase C-terminal domain-containing protein [Thermoplasmata archaeon]|nr:A24 family peptidase C-terminal domain-containing protein [Thermoplasmata archaeon]
MDGFAVARVLVGAGFLVVAAVLDVRTRRVCDPIWIAMGTAGLAVLALDILTSAGSVNDWLLFGSAAILFYAVFFGNPLLDEDGVHVRPVRLLLLAVAAISFFAAVLLPNPVDSILLRFGVRGLPLSEFASVPILMIVYQGFFQLGLLRGGADTKAMMALTLLLPYYPDLSPFPALAMPSNVAGAMRTVFPFSLVVLLNAAILFLAVPVAYLIVNAVRGEFEFPQALFGTKASLDGLPPHVWLMERVDRRGERVAVLFPSRSKDEAEEVAKLKAAGADRVWVQPKVPFMVPLLIGFVLACVVGNLMLGFLTAVLPHP